MSVQVRGMLTAAMQVRFDSGTHAGMESQMDVECWNELFGDTDT